MKKIVIVDGGPRKNMNTAQLLQRVVFEKAFEYNVVAPDSEINQMIEDENKLRRPELYK